MGEVVPLLIRPPQNAAVRLHIHSIKILDGLQRGPFTAPQDIYLFTSVIDGMPDQSVAFQGAVYPNVRNGDTLPLGTANDPQGRYTVYLREGPIPRILFFRLLVLRSNARLREAGHVASDIVADERYRTLTDQIARQVSLTNPDYAFLMRAADMVVRFAGKYLQATPDDVIDYYQANYTWQFDQLGQGRHPSFGAGLVSRIELAYEINVGRKLR